MNKLVINGILKKSSRGRAYLVYNDRKGSRKLVRLEGRLEFLSGQQLTVIGAFQSKNRSLQVERAIPYFFPRKAG